MTSTAQARKRWDAMLAGAEQTAKAARQARFDAMVNGPVSKLNSEKESVPSASPSQGNTEQAENEALLRLSGGDAERAATLKDLIQKQTAERYASAVALDHATNAVLSRRAGMWEKLTPGYVKMRQGIKCTDEVLDDILQNVADGVSIYRQCRGDDMPTSHAVTQALSRPEWIVKYQAALFRRADKMVDEIADASRELTAAVAAGASSEVVNAIKIHINTLQWIASRINPSKWGDKSTVDVNATVKLKESEVDDRLKALMNKAGVDLAALTATDPDHASNSSD
jgi:Bacteriophage Sf6, terminase small subunit-like